ncbi:MAG: transposase [Chlorobium phaeovibrioides]|nr:transposase [Chlorobium phaeovibrioides]
MPRGPRLDAPGTLHHVMIRGIDRGNIFLDDTDRAEFLARMGRLAKASGTGVYAFALMSNHVHMLLKSSADGLSAFMRRLLSGYAQFFNRRHKRVGHLFQNRYKSIICEEDAYFEKLVAYINLNPLRAGLVGTLKELSLYPWSGHAVMMNELVREWMDREYVLRFFADSEGAARKAYLEFVEQEIDIDREQELSGGGLLRSQGGWSKVLSMRKSGEQAQGDDRILGGDKFVREIIREAENRTDVQSSGTKGQELLNEAVKQACADAVISIAYLQSGSRSGELPLLRKALARKAVWEYGVSLAGTARQLGVTTSAVSQMLKKK